MTEIVRRSMHDLKPLNHRLAPAVREWADALRELWAVAGLTLTEFATVQHMDKSAVSRCLSGQRVPLDGRLLDELLAVLASNGYPVSPGLRTRLTQLQLRALEAAHPHAYKVRLLRDDLAVAITARREAERYARSLEERLAERERRIIELAEDATRQSAAWGSEYERLTEEIEQLTTQLAYATQRAAAAERRCVGLGSLLEHVDQTQPDERQEHDHLRSVDWDSAVSNLPLDDLNAVDHFLSVLLRLALRDQAETLANRVVTHITREQHSTRNITKRDGVLGLLATMRAEGLYDQANQLSTWMGYPTNHSERRAPYNYSPSIS